MYNEINHVKSNANKYSKLNCFLIILVHFTIIKVLQAIFCLLGLYGGKTIKWHAALHLSSNWH